jgi:cytochrome c biogenesis protein CcdA/thiol-disulfide isomerase/thioredoxin
VLTLVLIGLVGGFITGISPCVLPVLPVVFMTGGVRRRPYLIVTGLALSFSVFTLVGTLIVSALPVPQDIIRWAGLVVLVVLGVAMMFPAVQDLLERPFARMGRSRVKGERGDFVLGLALGAVYVPCAGPVLAAITVAGATHRIGVGTVALTLAFAVGTAAPLLFFALAGRGVAERVKAFRERQRAVRFVSGLVVIGLAVALTFNVTDVLQRAVPDYTSKLNQALDKTGAVGAMGAAQSAGLQHCAQLPSPEPVNCGKAPAITGIQQWFNTPDGKPLPASALKGKVVLVDFWAYSCINCQRAIPHLNAWYQNYKKDGLVVVGVHSPEYAFEHVPADVEAGAKRLHMTYPIALDNKFATWNNFGNNSWPAEYLIDAKGEVRHVAIGEGEYDTSESLIRQLLTAAHPGVRLPPATHVADTTPTDESMTPETYLGSERAQSYVGGQLQDGEHRFDAPSGALPDSAFALDGTWSVGKESLTAKQGASIKLAFSADDVYLDVGGTGTVTATLDGKTTTYKVSGAPNIYTVVHGDNPRSGTLDLKLSAGLSAYSFTFG